MNHKNILAIVDQNWDLLRSPLTRESIVGKKNLQNLLTMSEDVGAETLPVRNSQSIGQSELLSGTQDTIFVWYHPVMMCFRGTDRYEKEKTETGSTMDCHVFCSVTNWSWDFLVLRHKITWAKFAESSPTPTSIITTVSIEAWPFTSRKSRSNADLSMSYIPTQHFAHNYFSLDHSSREIRRVHTVRDIVETDS